MDTQTVYPGSRLTMTSAADLFALPPTDVSILASNYIVLASSFDVKSENNTLMFRVPASSSQYMDLNSSFLYIKVRLVKKDGTKLDSSDIVAPSNLFFYNMFQNCTASINGVSVATTDNRYSYQAGLPVLLQNGKGEKDSELSSILYYPDSTPDEFDVTKNSGFKTRMDLASESKTFDMAGPIPINICQQGKYLPPFCTVSFELSRQSPQICLDSSSTDKEYKYEVMQAELHVKMLTMNPEIVARHNLDFGRGKAQFPIRDTRVRITYIPSGSTNFDSEPLVNGKLPTVIVFGLVSEPAIYGKLNKSPWNFQNFGLKSITVTVDNNPALTHKIDLDFQNNCYLLGYRTLFKALGKGKDGNAISRKDYLAGNALYLFDIQASIGAEFHAFRTGELQVRMRNGN